MKTTFTNEQDLIYLNHSQPIGVGAFSNVILVSHKNNPSQFYALKKLFKKDEVEEMYIKREIELHKQLDHPNIIKCIDYFDDKDYVFLILEYAQKGDLFEFFKNGLLKNENLLKIFYQTGSAIQYLHERNIIHRDLKPENILLDKDMNVKLCDFGWSVQQKEGIRRKTLCGTYEYMSPEVFYGENQTVKVDVWGMGIFLYELFQQRPPFNIRKTKDFFENFSVQQLYYKKPMPQILKDLIEKMLIIDPNKRISMKEVLETPIFDQFRKKNSQQEFRSNSKSFINQKQQQNQRKSFMNKLSKKRSISKGMGDIYKKFLIYKKIRLQENNQRNCPSLGQSSQNNSQINFNYQQTPVIFASKNTNRSEKSKEIKSKKIHIPKQSSKELNFDQIWIKMKQRQKQHSAMTSKQSEFIEIQYQPGITSIYDYQQKSKIEMKSQKKRPEKFQQNKENKKRFQSIEEQGRFPFKPKNIRQSFDNFRPFQNNFNPLGLSNLYSSNLMRQNQNISNKGHCISQKNFCSFAITLKQQLTIYINLLII